MNDILCWLHDSNDPEHWVPVAEVVGLLQAVDGVLRHDLYLVPAALECAEAGGVDPARIVDWDPSRARWVA